MCIRMVPLYFQGKKGAKGKKGDAKEEVMENALSVSGQLENPLLQLKKYYLLLFFFSIWCMVQMARSVRCLTVDVQHIFIQSV